MADYLLPLPGSDAYSWHGWSKILGPGEHGVSARMLRNGRTDMFQPIVSPVV